MGLLTALLGLPVSGPVRAIELVDEAGSGSGRE